MKIFIAGATGVLGRRVVQQLGAAGHEVVGLSRSPANAAWLAQNGAQAREGDLFDADKLTEITADCEAMLHLATAIPRKVRTTDADWALNDRLRTEGTRCLVSAALRNRVKLYLQQSVTFVYGDRQGEWVDEAEEVPVPKVALLRSALEMEQIVLDAQKEGLPAITLRFAAFYAHDSDQTRQMLTMLFRGMMPVIGRGHTYWNLIHADDAARAVVQAVARYQGNTGETFNVVDNEPVPWQQLLSHLARALKARSPMHLPVFLAKLVLGGHTVDFLLANLRCSNSKICIRLGWEPQSPSYREGFAEVIKQWQERQ